MRRIVCFTLFFITSFAGISFADEAQANSQPKRVVVKKGEATSPIVVEDAETLEKELAIDFWGQFVQMLITLFCLIVVILAFAWVFRRMMSSRLKTLNESNAIRILERRSLNPKCNLYLLDILGKGVVIAETPNGVQTVTDLPLDGEARTLINTIQEKQDSSSFSNMVKKNLNKKASNYEASTSIS